MNYVRTDLGLPPKPKLLGPYKTCGQAMQAFQSWHNRNRNCSRKAFEYHCSHFIKFYGDKPLTDVTSESAEQFIQSLIYREPQPYSYDTVRLAVVTASSFVEYLRDEKCWDGANPFYGLMRKYANRFPAVEPEKSRIESSEWKLIFDFLSQHKLPAAEMFIEVARCTGLRPSEIYRLDVKNIDRRTLSWSVYVSKTSQRPIFRRIAIPKCLMAFLDSRGVDGKMPFGESTVRRHLGEINRETGLYLTPKIFRKDFAHRMEEIGADEGIINLHQGRAQSGVLYKNYLRSPDRAVRLCRAYVDAMFGETERRLERVK